MATTGTKALQGRLEFPNPRADSPEQKPDRQGWGWGREVGTWKGERWQRSWGREQKGDKGSGDRG